MSARRRWALLVAATAAMGALAGCGVGGEVAAFGPDDTTIEVEAGDDFRIDLSESPGVGDNWEVIEEPDPAVATVTGTSYEPDEPDVEGGGGRRSFELEATGDGTTTVAIKNCYRAGADCDVAPDEERFAPTLTFTVEVR